MILPTLWFFGLRFSLILTHIFQNRIPAALHPADFTARPQILEKEANPSYYDLISEFEKITGVGALLNTSFNLHGDPIVRGPEQAIYTFENSELDMLLMNDILISRVNG
ncbi:MAG TPA: carbamoyltransferase C-terminal domain-containing protein [Spirochaetota bacterium]|nr:carbamoyltransferase C-terminal domain-containing protein [Spirochaetota bacterium]